MQHTGQVKVHEHVQGTHTQLHVLHCSAADKALLITT
jgi:hypothetical protein